jgi:hypothetical protein
MPRYEESARDPYVDEETGIPKVNSQELTPAAAVAEVERSRYLSASERIKLRTAFENQTAVEFQRRLQYRIACSSEESHRYRP